MPYNTIKFIQEKHGDLGSGEDEGFLYAIKSRIHERKQNKIKKLKNQN